MTDPLPTPTAKKPKQWPWVVAAIIAAGVVIVIRVDNDPSTNQTRPATYDASIANVEEYNAPNRPAAPVTDPLTTDGIYQVGSEIQPGTYRAVRAEGSYIGIWTRCSAIDCATGTTTRKSSIINSGNIESQGFVIIEPTDVAVKLSGLVLTPAG